MKKNSLKFPGTLILTKEDLTKLEENFEDEDEEEKPLQEPGSIIKDIPIGTVLKVETKERKDLPPLLHSLTTLQREANKLYGFSADKTLKIAQKLYEVRKIISYPRTDSQHLGTSNKPLVKEILKNLDRENLIPRVDKVGKRVFDDSKLTDHHAIIPLAPPPDDLEPHERKLYNLIYRRFVGAFMPAYLNRFKIQNGKKFNAKGGFVGDKLQVISFLNNKRKPSKSS